MKRAKVRWDGGSKVLRSWGGSFRIVYTVQSFRLKTPRVLMVLYRWFVCIINSVYHLKLKVKYTHNSKLCIMPRWFGLPLFSLMLVLLNRPQSTSVVEISNHLGSSYWWPGSACLHIYWPQSPVAWGEKQITFLLTPTRTTLSHSFDFYPSFSPPFFLPTSFLLTCWSVILQ